jgi:1-acyl-sn-glycerol-3-phosphate acyltransferase
VVESLRTLRGGGVLVIFPEGEREWSDGKMLEFKSGAVHIAANAGVPILPVSVSGGNRIWPRGQKFPSLFRRVKIIYHSPMYLPERPDDTELDAYLQKINDDLVKTIGSAI